jgi:lipopolysaccharide/colanic/teichoic acid biosynthesis glycosyltransferase
LLLAAGISGLAMGRPILFRQERTGLRGTRFRICKFRTMALHTMGRAGLNDSNGDVERLTPAGRWLRRWSLDELPQLWNVLRGEMSLIGPRPLPAHYQPRYTPRHRRRHDVRPGITGWAQVRGRNFMSWQQRFDLDVWYVEHASFWLDLRILFESVAMVLTGAGVTPPGAALMPEFLGEPQNSR